MALARDRRARRPARGRLPRALPTRRSGGLSGDYSTNLSRIGRRSPHPFRIGYAVLQRVGHPSTGIAAPNNSSVVPAGYGGFYRRRRNDGIVAVCQALLSRHTTEPVMPLYFFDCHHLSCQEECIGHELPDRDAAHELAVQFAGEILQHEPHGLMQGHDLDVTVSDEHQLVLFSVLALSTAAPAVATRR